MKHPQLCGSPPEYVDMREAFLASRMAEDYGKLKTLWSEFKLPSEPK